MKEKEVKERVTKPEQYFSSPNEVVQCQDLPIAAKIEALKTWEFDIRQLEVASEENMDASSSTSLQDVHDAMHALGHSATTEAIPGGKA